MTIKINTARSFLDRGECWVSTEAAAFLALHLDDEGMRIANKALASLKEENEYRRLHGLEPRKRIVADDLRRALAQ